MALTHGKDHDDEEQAEEDDREAPAHPLTEIDRGGHRDDQDGEYRGRNAIRIHEPDYPHLGADPNALTNHNDPPALGQLASV